MKKKLAALILTLVMACSFCMTSCNPQMALVHLRNIPKVGAPAFQMMLNALFTTDQDGQLAPVWGEKQHAITDLDIRDDFVKVNFASAQVENMAK